MYFHGDRYFWDIGTSVYVLDGKGYGGSDGGEDENWMKDEKGESVAFWIGDGGGVWGRRGQVMGGSRGGRDEPTPLPHAVRLSYYDRGDGKFYRLDAVLPTERIRQLFSQKIFVDSGGYGAKAGLEQRYNIIEYAIAPRGYIVFWASKLGDAYEQVELGHYWAKERPGLTIAQWNANGGKVNPRLFPLNERWAINVEPETMAKLKAGWTPDPDYFVKAAIRYPWTVTMTGNAILRSYRLSTANAEVTRAFPWEMPNAVANPVWRALPKSMLLFFTDRKGDWYGLSFDLYSHDRFGGQATGEADLTPVSNAFKEMFPDIALDTRQDMVAKSGFAQVEIHMSDDLSNFDVFLVKGDKKIDLPYVGADSIHFSKVKPYSSYFDVDPSPAEVEWNKYGPKGRP